MNTQNEQALVADLNYANARIASLETQLAESEETVAALGQQKIELQDYLWRLLRLPANSKEEIKLHGEMYRYFKPTK